MNEESKSLGIDRLIKDAEESLASKMKASKPLSYSDDGFTLISSAFNTVINNIPENEWQKICADVAEFKVKITR